MGPAGALVPTVLNGVGSIGRRIRNLFGRRRRKDRGAAPTPAAGAAAVSAARPIPWMMIGLAVLAAFLAWWFFLRKG